MKKNQLIEYYKSENENFSFDDFFTNDENDLDKRAIVVFTPNQIIKARTPIIDDNKKRADHEPTYNNLTCILYNIGFDKDDNLIEYNNLSKDYKDYISYLQYHQNIVLLMCNVGVKHLKLICVHIPKSIFSNQLQLLEELEKEQGLLLKKQSKEMKDKSNDSLIVFADANNKIKTCDSLDGVIKYIKDNNLVNDTNPKLDEEIIFREIYKNTETK